MSPAGPDTDAVRARPATPLPWEAEYDDCDCGPDDRSCGHKIVIGIGPLDIEYDGDNSEADVEYVLAAINGYPALLDEIDRLRHLVDNRDRANALTAAARDALAGEVKEMREENGEIAVDQQLLWRENQKLRALLTNLVDPEDCQFDHHGGCQEHGFLSLEPGEICPNQAARDILATPAAENGANE